MASMLLTFSTGRRHVDTVIRGIVLLFETVFAARISGYYLEGSYADHSAVSTSDIDLTIVFRAAKQTADEQTLATQLLEACALMSAVELDITLTDIQQLQQADPLFKLGAQLVYGSEIRGQIPLMTIELWARQRMHAAFWLMIHVFDRPQPVHSALHFPDADDTFFGYAARPMRLADGTVIATTRNLLRVTGWIATARIAYEARQYVHRKRDCVTAYADFIGDEWTNLLATIDQRCRTDWQYRVPDTTAEQYELRSIVRHALAFENHFLSVYQRFLLTELSTADPLTQHVALEMLQRTQYSDPAIIGAVDALRASENPGIRTLANLVASQSA